MISVVNFLFSIAILSFAGKWKTKNLKPILLFPMKCSLMGSQFLNHFHWDFWQLTELQRWHLVFPKGLNPTVTPCLYVRVSHLMFAPWEVADLAKSPLTHASVTTQLQTNTWYFKLPMQMRVGLNSSLSVVINRNGQLQNMRRCTIMQAGGS